MAERLASGVGGADLAQLGRSLGLVTPIKGDRTPSRGPRRLSGLLLSPLLEARIEMGA
jgi:hypothetical protein